MRLLYVRMLLLVALALVQVDVAPDARAATPAAGPSVRVGQLGGAVTAVSAAGQLAVIGEGSALSVVDIGDVANPVRRATLPLADLVSSVQLVGTLAYATVANQAVIVDVQNADSPRVRATLSFGDRLRSVQVVGARLYALTEAGLVSIVDVRDPDRPAVSGALVAASGSIVNLWVEGTRTYMLTDTSRLEIVDLADDAPPLLRSTTYVEYVVFSLHLRVIDGIAYLLAGGVLGFTAGALVLIDVRDAAHPRVRGRLDTQGDVVAVGAVGERAYISTVYQDESTMVAVDIRDLDRPTVLAAFGPSAGAYALVLVGTLLLAASGENGLRLYNTQAVGVAPLAQLPGLGSASVVRQSEGMAYVLSGRRLCIIDVRDPTHPLLRGSVALPDNGTSLQLVGTRAYIGIGSPARSTGGLAVVDVQDGDAPRIRSTVELSGPVKSLVVTSTVAYAAYGYTYLSRIAVIDVSNDDVPTVKTTIGARSYFGDLAVEGQQFYALSFSELRVFDIRTPLLPQSLGAVAMQLTEVGGSPRLQAKHGRVYVAIDKELRIYDVRTPVQPLLVGSVMLPRSAYRALHVTNDTALLSLGDTLAVASVAEAQPPALRGVLGIPHVVFDIDSDGAFVYIATESGGLIVQRIDPALFSRVLLPVIAQRYSGEQHR